MKAISVRQPWAWLLVNGFKDIENRDWPHPPSYRGRVLIHASKKLDLKLHTLLIRYTCWSPVSKYEPFKGMSQEALKRMAATYPLNMGTWTGGIVGMAEMTDVVRAHPSGWFDGPLGFVMENASPLPFMHLKGSLGLFNAEYPQDIIDQVDRNREANGKEQ